MSERRRGWVLALIASSALLVVPFVVWFLLPNPGLPPKRPRLRTTEATTTEATAPSARATSAPSPPPAARPAVAKESKEASAEEGVTGSVLDPDGQPIASAFVGCDDRSSHLTTTTDGEGRFRLPMEASGCSVVAHHPTYPSSDRTPIEAGKDNVIRLNNGGSIEGVVVDEQGRPVAPYRLSVELFLPKVDDVDLGIRGRPINVRDESGTFKWEHLPAGKYVLVASASGQPPGKSDSVQVEVGQTARNVRIVLPRGATLSGTVRDEETRKPIAGANVTLDGMPGGGPSTSAPATTDAQGNYSLSNVPPGPFSVRVDHDSYKSRIVTGLTTRGATSMREDLLVKPRADGGTNGELEGIGAVLAPSPKGVVIASLIESGPAAKADLRRGDRLVRIDGASALEMTLSDVIQRVRGPEGSRVSLTVSREGEGNIDVTVMRARIDR